MIGYLDSQYRVDREGHSDAGDERVLWKDLVDFVCGRVVFFVMIFVHFFWCVEVCVCACLFWFLERRDVGPIIAGEGYDSCSLI